MSETILLLMNAFPPPGLFPSSTHPASDRTGFYPRLIEPLRVYLHTTRKLGGNPRGLRDDLSPNRTKYPTSRFTLLLFRNMYRKNWKSYCMEFSMCETKVGGETWS